MARGSRRDEADLVGDGDLNSVAIVGTQVHGYRRGHELLATSAKLPKPDQSVVDRLSDVAGPLRPNERFDAYLTGYPLPGGAHYVLARTWQDLDAPRAGCVRTKSLLIPTADWSSAQSLMPFIDMLDAGGFPEEATAVAHEIGYSRFIRFLPPTPDFGPRIFSRRSSSKSRNRSLSSMRLSRS